MREINKKGLELVKRWEGVPDGNPATVNLDPYLDPVGIWTIGWGHAIIDPRTDEYLRGSSAKTRAFTLYPGGITTTQAEDLLRADLLDAARNTAALVKVPMNDNQFSALVSFEFNTGSLSTSTLLRKLNVGDYLGAAAQFDRWNKGTVNGILVILSGLVSRRAAERKLFEETP